MPVPMDQIYASKTDEYLAQWITPQEKKVESDRPSKHFRLEPDQMQSWERILDQLLLDFPQITAVLHERSRFERGADVASEVETLLSWLSSPGVAVPRPDEVRDYLLSYSDIISLVRFVCGRTCERFSPDTQLSLEVYRDPEIEDEYLTLYVRQAHYDESILDIIEDISAEYEGELAARSGWLLVTTDFEPPK